MDNQYMENTQENTQENNTQNNAQNNATPNTTEPDPVFDYSGQIHDPAFGFVGHKPEQAQGAHSQTREEWERQQREIQDREWRNMQAMYNRQLSEQRSGQEGYPHMREWYGHPQGAYHSQPDQYAPQAAQPDGAWQQYGVRQAYPQQTAQYAHNQYAQGQAGPAQGAMPPQYQDSAYYYRPGQPQTPPEQTPQGHAPAGRAPMRKEERQGKRKSRIRVLAASIIAALVIAAVFTAGFYAGNGGFNFNIWTAQNERAAAETDAAQTVGQTDQPAATSGNNNQSGLFGNRQERPSMLPPTARQDQGEEAGGAEDNPAQVQPQTQSSAGSSQSLILNPPHEGEMSVPEIYQKVYPSIVGVRITFLSQAYRFGGIMMPGQERSGEGSGIIIREDGYIMTNHHVVSEVIDANTRKQLDGTKIEVFLPDDATTAYPAVIVGYDQSTDLCVLKIDKNNLKAAELGDADRLVVGEFVVAIGNPGGMEYMSSVTFGVISGLNRSIQTEGYRNIQLIQTDAAINPGNSGGPLVNTKGEVVGINTAKIRDSQVEGMGYSITSNVVKDLIENLMNRKEKPTLGVWMENLTKESAAMFNIPQMGVLVTDVIENSSADIAGIKRLDLITGFNDMPVLTMDDLRKYVGECEIGDEVVIKILRDGHMTMSIKVKMLPNPEASNF